MKRQELQAEVENVLLHTVLMSPCIQCGGDEFRVRHVSRAMAYYLCELVKTYKYNEGMDFEKAKKHADKKTSRFFADLATEELEKLLGTPIGDLPDERGGPDGVELGPGTAVADPAVLSGSDSSVVGGDVAPVEPVGTEEAVSSSETPETLEALPTEARDVARAGGKRSAS